MLFNKHKLKGIRMEGSNTEFGLSAARQLIQATDEEWPQYIGRLRQDRQLWTATHQINRLLDQPEHRELAIDAFKRIGLWNESLGTPKLRAARANEPEVLAQVHGDNQQQPDLLIHDMAHVLEMDEPMAGAGAQLSDRHIKSETEKALQRATRIESSDIQDGDRGLGNKARVLEFKPVAAMEPQLPSKDHQPDDARPDRLVHDMAHMLVMDEPMAGAGAQLSGRHIKGETEKALDRATRFERSPPRKKAIGNRTWVRVALVAALAVMALLLIRVLGAAGYTASVPSTSSSLV